MLKLTFLGPFQASIDDRPLPSFRYAKVRALLAYLVTYPDRPVSRLRLAGMLWPDLPDQAAGSNMRNAIFYLRRALCPPAPEPITEPIPFLFIGQDTIQFNASSQYWLDVADFEKCVSVSEQAGSAVNRRETLEALETGTRLYGGRFLDGLESGSLAFDEWISLERDRLQEAVLAMFQRLADAGESAGDFRRMQDCARRQLEIDPFREVAHRQLIRALALAGQQGAALTHYRQCQTLLEKELNLGPSCEMVSLYRQIVEGEVQQPAGGHPVVVGQTGRESTRDFVARERELAQLHDQLMAALAEGGRVAFVSGGIGSGKTTLLDEFVRRTTAQYEEVIAVKSRCLIHGGAANPCLPFVEILKMLSGGVDARLDDGPAPEQAQRLHELRPAAIHALMEEGTPLLGTLLPVEPLLADVRSFYPSSAWEQELLRIRQAEPDPRLLHTDRRFSIFEQVVRVLTALSHCSPLVLILDDLQWADDATLELLLQLDRHLKGARILVVGAYRSTEASRSYAPAVHSTLAAIRDFQRNLGNATIDLDWVDSRHFVDVFLDRVSNEFTAAFRQSFHRFSGGNALVVRELWAGMQQDGSLACDEAGKWNSFRDPGWMHLSERVMTMTAMWVDALSPEMRDILEAASVEGEDFTAEVVARVVGLEERLVVKMLSGPLSREWNLIHARGVRRYGTRQLSQYGFRHLFLQQYLYRNLDAVQKNHLHSAVGAALEEIFGDDQREMNARSDQLSWHFDAAGFEAKALEYARTSSDGVVRRPAAS
jgi:DNA-binding SARP family transcriptional activator